MKVVWLFAQAMLMCALASSCRGDQALCERATRNVFTLTFWHDADQQIAALPQADQLAKRRMMEAKFDTMMKQDFARVTSQCVAANDSDRANCMIKADTCAKAKACMPDDTTVDISKICQ
jgi:hypothetical protein